MVVVRRRKERRCGLGWGAAAAGVRGKWEEDAVLDAARESMEKSGEGMAEGQRHLRTRSGRLLLMARISRRCILMLPITWVGRMDCQGRCGMRQ